MVDFIGLLLGFSFKLCRIAESGQITEEGESEPGLVFDYLRLSHMIDDGSLLPIQAEERERERERMKSTPVICGDHLIPITDCDCLSYMQELKTSAERLIQLAKERESLK